MPGLATLAAEPERDRAALEALALWAGRYGPRRNTDSTDGLWIDVTGVAHLFGGEKLLIDDLIVRLARAGITARVGLADTAAAAFALARFATSARTPWRIAKPGDTQAALADLPVGALRLLPDALMLLRRLGLGRIGQLDALPREALAQRFRSDAAIKSKRGSAAARRERAATLLAGSVLARLDRAFGRTPEPLVAIEEPPQHVVRQVLAEPLISTEGVTALATTLAGELAGLLEARAEGGTGFVLSLYRTDGSSHHVRAGASRPCRDAGHLMALLGEKLAGVDAGFGIDAMALACTHVEPLGAQQATFASADKTSRDAAAAALLDRLSNRLGSTRVVRLAPIDSHIPERAEQRVPLMAGMPAAATAAGTSRQGRLPSATRPAFLLPAPEQIAVLAEVPEGPPRQFTWRRLVRRVVRAEGPERIEPEWWRAIGSHGAQADGRAPQEAHLNRPRDYYAVEDAAGGRYWLFRAGLYGRDEDATAPVWFVHGIFG